jgi:serine protease inhibitor
MQDLFNADVYCADFEDSKTKNLINQWCSNKTNGKFNGVIDSIDPTTLLMLINAMYFEGIWCSKFDKTKTFESTFDGLNRQSKIDVMSSFMKTECFVTDDYCAIVLYFGLTELYLILPSSDIETFCRTLTPECVNKMIKDKGIYDVNLGLPRFSVGNTADLKPVLTSMGLPEKVYIDKTGIPYIFEADYDISQKTYANFDEDGSVLVSVNFAYMLVGHPWIIDVLGILNVTFDKPFAFFIRNYTTGTILMAGRVCDI